MNSSTTRNPAYFGDRIEELAVKNAASTWSRIGEASAKAGLTALGAGMALRALGEILAYLQGVDVARSRVQPLRADIPAIPDTALEEQLKEKERDKTGGYKAASDSPALAWASWLGLPPEFDQNALGVPLFLAASGLGLWGGVKLMDRILGITKRTLRAMDLEDAKKEFEKTLIEYQRRMSPQAQKVRGPEMFTSSGEKLGAALDAMYDSLAGAGRQQMLEKQGWSGLATIIKDSLWDVLKLAIGETGLLSLTAKELTPLLSLYLTMWGLPVGFLTGVAGWRLAAAHDVARQLRSAASARKMEQYSRRPIDVTAMPKAVLPSSRKTRTQNTEDTKEEAAEKEPEAPRPALPGPDITSTPSDTSQSWGYGNGPVRMLTDQTAAGRLI